MITSEGIIEKLLHQKKISVKEAMVLIKDCVKEKSISNYNHKFEDYSLSGTPFVTTGTHLTDGIIYTTNNNTITANLSNGN